MCDKFIKKSIYNAFIFTAAYHPKHNDVCERKMLRRHPVVLKETRNRADTKLSVTVEPEFILSLIGKFHSNPLSSFWGDAITRKIKDGRRGHVFRQSDFILVLAQLDIEGNILTKIFKKIRPVVLEEMR